MSFSLLSRHGSAVAKQANRLFASNKAFGFPNNPLENLEETAAHFGASVKYLEASIALLSFHEIDGESNPLDNQVTHSVRLCLTNCGSWFVIK